MGKEQTKISGVELEDYSGGLNSNPLSKLVKDSEATSCQNCIYYDGSLQDIPGFSRHSYKISNERITGIYDFQKRDGTKYLVCTTASDIMYFNTATNKWTSIKGALTVTDHLHDFIVFNDRLIGTNKEDVPWTWNGVGNAVTLASLCGVDLPPLNAKHVAVFNDRVVFIQFIDNTGAHFPTGAAFSDIDNSLKYDLTNQTWEFETDDGQEITGARQLGNKFIVYKTDSIGYVTGSGLIDWAVVRDWKKGIGCVSGYTPVTGFLLDPSTGSLTEAHVFMSTDGPRAIDESGTVYLLPLPDDTKLYKCFKYFDTVSKADLTSSCGVFYRKRNWYISFFASSGATKNDSGFIYDFNKNALWPLHDVRASCATEVHNVTNNTYDIYIGTEDGLIYVLTETNKGIESSTELVTDGDMEAVGTAAYTSYLGGTISKSAATFIQGAQGLELDTAGSGQGFYQNVTTVVGQRYRARCHALATVGAAGSWELDVLDGTTNLGLDYTTHSTTAWTTSEVTFTATSTTTTLLVTDRRGAGGHMVVDDLSCRCIEVDSFWTSKFYDFGDEQSFKILREMVPLITASGSGSLVFTITYEKQRSVVTTDTVIVSTGTFDWDDIIDWASLIDWSIYSYEEYATALSSLTQEGFRTMQFRITNNKGTYDWNVNRMFFNVIPIGNRFFYNP